MIQGIGTDLLEINRIQRILQRPIRFKFLNRVLTPAEQQLAKLRTINLTHFVAGRFAAKEAIAKAIGSGIGQQIGFQDIEILPDAKGRPVACLSQTAKRNCLFESNHVIHLTITHSQHYASAFAIIELQIT